jgi:hypothetical protein
MNSDRKIENSILILLVIQGLYYFLTGLWPIVHIESFIWVTGPKEDIWLVKSFGLLISIIGVVFLVSSRSIRINRPVVTLAILSALGFIAIDTYYVFTNTISPVYLADAAAQFILLLFWTIFLISLQKK